MRKERTEHNRLRMSLAGTLTGLYIFPIIYNIEKAMKTLLILRPDHDRPLHKRGKNDVPRMGKSITPLKHHYHELEHFLLGFL